MTALARLHQEADKIRRRLNPMPDLITFASNDIANRVKRNIHTKNLEEDSDTVYVNLNVDSEEDLEPKYINLYIDTNRKINSNYINLGQNSHHLTTRIVYLNGKPTANNKPYLSYPRYHRQHRNK